jgi:hypothetical protein
LLRHGRSLEMEGKSRLKAGMTAVLRNRHAGLDPASALFFYKVWTGSHASTS